jgi:hypothetical protein
MCWSAFGRMQGRRPPVAPRGRRRGVPAETRATCFRRWRTIRTLKRIGCCRRIPRQNGESSLSSAMCAPTSPIAACRLTGRARTASSRYGRSTPTMSKPGAPPPGTAFPLRVEPLRTLACPLPTPCCHRPGTSPFDPIARTHRSASRPQTGNRRSSLRLGPSRATDLGQRGSAVTIEKTRVARSIHFGRSAYCLSRNSNLDRLRSSFPRRSTDRRYSHRSCSSLLFLELNGLKLATRRIARSSAARPASECQRRMLDRIGD